jgi:uncharacterized protein (DUF433 family)
LSRPLHKAADVGDHRLAFVRPGDDAQPPVDDEEVRVGPVLKGGSFAGSGAGLEAILPDIGKEASRIAIRCAFEDFAAGRGRTDLRQGFDGGGERRKADLRTDRSSTPDPASWYSPIIPELLGRITSRPDKFGGRPCIRGLRIRVVDGLDLLAAGLSHAQFVQALPDLEPDDIKAALAFAARRVDHPLIAAG